MRKNITFHEKKTRQTSRPFQNPPFLSKQEQAVAVAAAADVVVAEVVTV